MKFVNILLLLGLAEITLKAGFFGKKPSASFDEDQLKLIDEALAKNSTTDLEQRIAELEESNTSLQTSYDGLANVLEQALELNGMEPAKTPEESIEALGLKCKEYGTSKARHTLVGNDGQDSDPSDGGLIDGIFDPNDKHNQID